MTALSNDDRGARLCAWLDRELPADEAQQFEAALEHDAELRRDAADFKQGDALLRDWYAALPDEREKRLLVLPPPARKSGARWKFFTAAGIAAAAVAIVLLAIPAVQGRHAVTLAQYAMDKTADAIARTKGMTADVRVAIVKYAVNEPKAGTLEKHAATGRIVFANINAPHLQFVSTEHWDATADEPVLTREWGQLDGEQWLAESQGGNANAFSLQYAFDPDEQSPASVWTSDRDDGSPVDVRTRQAVEGLAVLVRSFGHDRFLKWMGCQWIFAGGTGATGDPWLYTVQPFANSGGSATVWTLRVWSDRADGVADGVDLEETLTNTQSGLLEQTFRTTYTLQFSDTELQVKHKGASDEKASNAAKDDGGF